MIPLETITSHASEFPERIVLREGGQEVTWDDFRTMVAAIRDWASRRLDPAQENKAVAFAGNTVPLVVAAGAMATLGIPWVGIDPARDWATVRAQFGAVSPTVALVDSSLPNGDAVAELARERRVLTLDLARAGAPIPGVTPFGTAVAGPGPRAEWTRPAFLALGFTSGTTGTPKLFARRTRAENQRLAYLRDHFGFGRNDTYLVTSPLAHASGHVWANAALALGATVLLGGPDPDWIADTVAARGVTGMFVVPPVLDAFLRCACDRPDADLSSLRALLTGGRQVSAWSVRAAARRLGEVLHVYYATTETGINTFACPGDLAVAPLSAGVALPDVRLLVVDPVTHADMPTGQTGLIAVSSPLNMDSYLTGQADMLRCGDGTYVLTSDYGYLDADGRLFIAGRADSLDTVLLESELKELPGVRDVCTARRERDDATEIVACVMPDPAREGAPGAIGRRLGDLLAASGAKYDDYSVAEIPTIPYNTAGKVDVRALNALLDDSRLPTA